MTLGFTVNAVRRYRDYHMLDRPTATDDEARAILEAHANDGIKTGRAWRGDPLWKIEALGIELVAKREGDVDVCVTVLPPPKFRNLTPLQAEAVTDSLARASALVVEVEAEIAATPPPPTGKPKTMVERREAQDAETRRLDLKRRHVSARVERDLLATTLKTMRHQLDREQNESNLKEIARIALRYIRGTRDPAARVVLDEVAKLNPALVTDAFLGVEVAEVRQQATRDPVPRMRVARRLRGGKR